MANEPNPNNNEPNNTPDTASLEARVNGRNRHHPVGT